MSSSSFVHLHLHTEFSLLDGSVRIDDLMKKVNRCKMPAVAMTDHGNIFGAINFYQSAKKYNVKPIIGCEAYLTPQGALLTEKNKVTGGKNNLGNKNSHITLLASSNKGYENLIKLVSISHLYGMYYKPRIDKEVLSKYSEGIICLSGCINGEVNQFIRKGDIKRARDSVSEFVDIFGKDRFFLEIHDHGLEDQFLCAKQMINFSKEFDLGLVAANDVHFLNESDHSSHDAMICIGTGSFLLDEKRMKYSPEVYFKTSMQMRKLFKEVPQACDNTLRIADMCNVEIHLDATNSDNYPKYHLSNNLSREEYFEKICKEGLVMRYGNESLMDKTLTERLNYEISIMEKMGFVSYFLITWDFVKWAKDNKIPIGPGRGSAAGSLVAYVLGITNICPLRFGLIFERFLNPERVSPPDIDIDFCQTRRPEVIEYVRSKYGELSVSHIVTFGKLGAKSVVRDVARVMGLSFTQGDEFAKMIPNEINISLKEAKKKNPEITKEIEKNPTFADLWSTSTFLEGLTRGTGIHAAGVVIGDKELTSYIPLTRGKEGEIVTQYAMSPLTELGMLKMDFLGLKTLTVIQDAVDLISLNDPNFELDQNKFDDNLTFDLLNKGETVGVFQLESSGMMTLCKQFKIDKIEDIIALIALYRPGPMDLIPDFVNRKTGKEKPRYLHPLLEEVSKETYGILIYQEQVQYAANLLAGYSLGEADLLRRAMGKKNLEEMTKQREKFVLGCKNTNNISETKANDIFNLLEKFAGYGFNKSHSAAYAIISYHTAYLKANNPVEFMSALLSNEINNTDKISIFVSECQRMGIKILSPDVNKSQIKFSTEVLENGDKAIRYGLCAIKNVGEAAMVKVVEERNRNGEFKSMNDFSVRIDSKAVNRKILESLIKSGAFDFVGERRDKMFSRINHILLGASHRQKDRSSGQISLFDEDELDFSFYSNVKDEQLYQSNEIWDEAQCLSYEKSLLGFYITGHPLNAYKKYIEKRKYYKINATEKLKVGKDVKKFCGILNEVTVKYSKKDGKAFAILTLEDFTGFIEVMVWNNVYLKSSTILQQYEVVEIKSKIGLDSRSGNNHLIAESITKVDINKEVSEQSSNYDDIVQLKNSKNIGTNFLKFRYDEITFNDMLQIKEKAYNYPGNNVLIIKFDMGKGNIILIESGDSIKIRDDFFEDDFVKNWVE